MHYTRSITSLFSRPLLLFFLTSGLSTTWTFPYSLSVSEKNWLKNRICFVTGRYPTEIVHHEKIASDKIIESHYLQCARNTLPVLHNSYMQLVIGSWTCCLPFIFISSIATYTFWDSMNPQLRMFGLGIPTTLCILLEGIRRIHPFNTAQNLHSPVPSGFSKHYEYLLVSEQEKNITKKIRLVHD